MVCEVSRDRFGFMCRTGICSLLSEESKARGERGDVSVRGNLKGHAEVALRCSCA